MEDNELKAIQEVITRQITNNYPQIYIKSLQSGRIFEYGKNCHDRLVISEDGRSLHYENLQDGDGSCCGDYRFYYEKPKIETEMDKMHEWDLDRWARSVKNKSLDKLAEFEDFMEEQGFESLEEVKRQCDLVVDVLAMDSENHQLNLANTKLGEENQALKDRWAKLKRYMLIEKDWGLDENFIDYSYAIELVLKKMQELEKEGN